MPIVNVEGVNINFPFEPYKCQIDFMRSVVKSLINKKNAILESPTGTGKTLCLLCSSIAWLLNAKADLQFSAIKNEIEDERIIEANQQTFSKSGITAEDPSTMTASGVVNGSNGYPKIIYASRTHSQLSQVVKELKMSSYNNIKTCVIGSRDQLCINPQVNVQKNYTVKLNMCKAKVNAKTCYFYNNIETNQHEFKNLNTVDIEDLVKFGNKFKCCPYYSARSLKDTADVLFMPYNYLLDKKLRKSNGIELKNTIIIFDEAHNVERICEDSASAELTTTDIASAMNEIGFLLDDIKNSIENDEQLGFGQEDNFKSIETDGDLMNLKNMPATIEELGQIKILLKNLEDQLDKIQINEQTGLTRSALFLFELLGDCGIHVNNKGVIFDILQRLLQYFGAQVANSRHHNGASLAKFNDFLQIVFSEKSIAIAMPQAVSENQPKPKSKTNDLYKVHIKYDTTKTRVLCYWCFSASQVMQELLDEGVRSIILTSGTLSPIESLKIELRIPFDIVLENPHIIKGDQIKVMSINKGPKGVALRSNYENRLNDGYVGALGSLIIDQIKIIPAGVLVFFPSYHVLEQTLNIWRKTNQWEKIGDIKSIFIESKNAKECNDTIVKYYERIRDPKCRNGAILFAVCRGKMSEGIDFSNDNGRAVIITGLPYPPYKDPRVVLKKQYLDDIKLKNLSGMDWYNQQAFRAVNQAIGRVIRHKDDYGSVLLCDERFSYDSSIKQMPAWIKPYLIKVNDCQLAIDQLRSFFKVAYETLPKIVNKSITSCSSAPAGFFKDDQNKQKENSAKYYQMLAGDYKQTGAPQSSSTTTCTNNMNLLNALENVTPSQQCNVNSCGTRACATATTTTGVNSFQNILQKRKEDEAKANGNKFKCKVVIKDTVTVADSNANKLSNSQMLLDRVRKVLNEEENRQFKLALHNFHYAKKSGDLDSMEKYYLVLKSIFKVDEQLFREVETFIRYKPSIGQKTDEIRFSMKRKFNEDD